MKRTLPMALAAVLIPLAGVAAIVQPASADPAITCANTAKTPMTGLIDGSVDVPDGASCYIQDATITGAFSAIHSPAVVSLINTNVLSDGGIFVKGATKRVVIGSAGCKPDPYAGRNLKVFDSHLVAICEMSVRNNIMVKGTTGNVLVRDSIACNNLMVTDSDVAHLRVVRNQYTPNLMLDRNTVSWKSTILKNVATGQTPDECRDALAAAGY